MKRALLSPPLLILLALAGFAGSAAAVVPEKPQTMQLVIYNNSTRVLYLFIGKSATHTPPGEPNPDLWMQARFTERFPNFDYPNFTTELSYRAVINITNPNDKNNPTGLRSHESVSITVPFFTQLEEVTNGNIGKVDDQFIDWFNSNRLYLFEGATAFNAADIADGLIPTTPHQHHPTVIDPLKDAVSPTCKASGGSTCTVTIKAYTIEPPFNIPFQLQEYTLLSAEGPPLNPPPAKLLPEKWLNYNVSSLDSVYLPIAMGPLGNRNVPYVGSTQTIAEFHKELGDFAKNGDNWPIFLPVYFSGTGGVNGAGCSLKPFNNDEPYALPKLPGMFNMLVLSYLNPPPIPPTLTSDPPNYAKFYTDQCPPETVPPFETPNLGTTGQGVANLWKNCVTDNAGGKTCVDIRSVHDFFVRNYENACLGKKPSLLATMEAVYGFVPITDKDCTGGALTKTTNPPITYADLVKTYCSLQYNYLTGATGEGRFNPYTQLIHQTLQSSAYAFSIDDGVSFKHVIGDGIIFSIVGTHGLENDMRTDLPDKSNFLKQCTQH